MSIILKYILKNIKEKKIRSLLIIVSLTLTVIVLGICLTLKDDALAKYEEFLMKTSGTSDILLSKEDIFEKTKLDNISDNYKTVPVMRYSKDNKNIIGANIKDLQENKMTKSELADNLKETEVIISNKTAESKNIKLNDEIEVLGSKLKVVEITEKYGLFMGETEENPIYLVSIECANKIMYDNLEETVKPFVDESKTYIVSAYIDVLDDDTEKAKEDLKKIDEDFSIVKIKADVEANLNMMNSLMIIMLVITILIAFYIISSILKLVLEERIAVIGTFRSIGASRRKTNFLIYLENSMYAIISSVLGIIIANSIISPMVASMITVGVEMEFETKSGLNLTYMAIIIIFTLLIQLGITFMGLRKNKKKSIREIIFDTQDTKYKTKRIKVVMGVILVLLAYVLHIINNNYDFIKALLSIILGTVGFIMIMPMITKIISCILSGVFRNKSASYLAAKNIGDNKILISSITLLFIIISMTAMIYNTAVTIAKTYDSIDEVVHYKVKIANVSGDEQDYQYIDTINGVKRKAFQYLTYNYFKVDDIENIFIFYGYDNKDYTTLELYEGVVLNKEEADELKDDEILLDEAFAIKNNKKIGDKIKVNYDEDYYFTVKGFVDSSNLSSQRAAGVITKDEYNKIFKNKQKFILIDTDLDAEEMKEILKKEIKTSNLEILTWEEDIGEDKQNTAQIMSIVYTILFLGMLLAMVGLVNNGLISFMQRKRGLAVLNSVCMSKVQLYKMALWENVFSYIVAMIPGLLQSVVINLYIEKALQGIGIFLNFTYDIKRNNCIAVCYISAFNNSNDSTSFKIKKIRFSKGD